MASVSKDFFTGAGILHAGLKAFYRQPRFWVYALLPMGILLLLYCFVLLMLILFVAPMLTALLPAPESLGAWGGWIIYTLYGLVYVTLILLSLIAGTLLLSTLYEALGSVFFDSLIVRFEKECFGFEPPQLSWKQNVILMFQSLRFSLLTFLLSLVCLIPVLFLPVAGALPAVFFVGYRFGVSCLFSSAFAHGVGVGAVCRMAREHRALVLGFGVAGYLWLLIPFAVVLLLPGFLLGGSMLFQKIGRDGEKSCSDSQQTSPTGTARRLKSRSRKA